MIPLADSRPPDVAGTRSVPLAGRYAGRMSVSVPLDPRPSALDEPGFVACYGDVYEHSPWIAHAAWRAGLGAEADTAEGLAERMATVVRDAEVESQLALIRAHPDLAGKAAVAGELTADSGREQTGAGLDQCTLEEFSRLRRLNTEYRTRFGFPFVIAVGGLQRADILAEFERRLGETPDAERRNALEQINRIALLRLRRRAAR